MCFFVLITACKQKGLKIVPFQHSQAQIIGQPFSSKISLRVYIETITQNRNKSMNIKMKSKISTSMKRYF